MFTVSFCLCAGLTPAGHEGGHRNSDVAVWEDGQWHQVLYQHTTGGWHHCEVLSFVWAVVALYCMSKCVYCVGVVPPRSRPQTAERQDDPVCVCGAEGPEQRFFPSMAGDLPVTTYKTVYYVLCKGAFRLCKMTICAKLLFYFTSILVLCDSDLLRRTSVFSMARIVF